MSTPFKNILIPVDFSINTEIAVKKALGLIDSDDAVIHLVHVVTSAIPTLNLLTYFAENVFQDTGEGEIAIKKLREWQTAIMETMPDLIVQIHILKGGIIQHHVAKLAKKIHPQLIIIGKHNYHNWFTFLNTIDPNKLGKLTNCPVLTVKMGSLNNKIRSIVFPVKCFVPNRKIDLLITIARKYRARVYLIILVNPVNAEPSPLYNAFIDTYRQLKLSLRCSIEYRSVTGRNLARATLDFAQSIKADMILVSPDSETKISLLTGKQVNDVINGTSKLEVLSVEPTINAFLN